MKIPTTFGNFTRLFKILTKKMNLKFLSLFLICYLISTSLLMSVKDKQRSVYLEHLQIKSDESGERFPNSYRITLDKFGKSLRANFVKNDDYQMPELTHSIDGRMQKIELSDNNDHQTYRDLNGRGFATLYLRNGELRMV